MTVYDKEDRTQVTWQGKKCSSYENSMARHWDKYHRGQSKANYTVCISKVLIYEAHKVGKKNTFLVLVMMEVRPEAGLTLQTDIKYTQEIMNIYDNVFHKHIEPITAILDNPVPLNLQVRMLQRKWCSTCMENTKLHIQINCKSYCIRYRKQIK